MIYRRDGHLRPVRGWTNPELRCNKRSRRELSLFKPLSMDFKHVDCKRIPEQKGTSSFQADVGVNLETITAQVAARQEFARLPKNRQQRGVIALSTEQNKQFDPGG